MSVHSFEELISHETHEVNVVSYGPPGGEAVNVAIECEDCDTVLLDFDREPTSVQEDQS